MTNQVGQGAQIVRVGGGREELAASQVELVSNSPDEPGRMKRWGFVSARPSEFLIVYRSGQIRRRVSVQGGRCFKLPSDTVAIIPTTLKEVVFQANQITVDNVDVRLRGMVIFRILDPMRIYRLINFTSRQAGEEKLARMVADMCRSTTKWLVANMGVADCVRRRKEDIALQLKQEVASVVSSEGSHGWGVEIVTIDIQDIYIQDEALFEALQAKFKSEQEREARLARLESERAVTHRQLEADGELARKKHDLAVEKERMASDLKKAEIAREQECDTEKFRLDRFRVEQNEAIALLKAMEEEKRNRLHMEQEQERERLRTEAERERAEIQAETRRVLAEEEVRGLRARFDAESAAGPASLERLFVSDALPRLAETMAGSMRHARFNVIQNANGGSAGVSPLHFALREVLDFLDMRGGRSTGTVKTTPGNPSP